MDYELAKQLKEAGYDFSKSPTVYDDEIGCPVLSELIKVASLDSLEKGLDNKWRAYGSFGYGGEEGEGDTPEEAVARLWLELRWQELNRKTNE